jgi:hypothetical protein
MLLRLALSGSGCPHASTKLLAPSALGDQCSVVVVHCIVP